MQVIACPECKDDVSIPESLATDAKLQCPLCMSEYAMQSLIDSLPPQLVVLDPDAPVSSRAQLQLNQVEADASLLSFQIPQTKRQLMSNLPMRERLNLGWSKKVRYFLSATKSQKCRLLMVLRKCLRVMSCLVAKAFNHPMLLFQAVPIQRNWIPARRL